ncbi:hypothetical protein BDB00DRAFT_965006 [Zychaea mexicana]|uniref:uncharacterized protein n=1 Tax=Zychaea mexicana TaxID=64656 RepID=UPI0022FDC6A3|nr:uncharacterized protein BDB00DRAFT_965006 [Zychaea mexicana]KAI9484683.1 hypothetical protein BDB00DRAFT_965006 [Zychaea mexicana]
MDYMKTRPKKAFERIKSNLTLHELSGSLGDLGTLLPIMVSLAIAGQINLTSTLWFGGLWNIASGLGFHVPMCVQPMKAIAATVLSSNLTIEENMSAGLGVAAIIFFLGATRTIHLVGSYTPVAVVRGIQFGAAASLMKKAYDLVKTLEWTITADNWSDNNTWVLLSFIFVIICYRTRIPSALILFIIGLIFALIRMFGTERDTLGLPWPVAAGHYPDTIIGPTPEEFRNGFATAGLGQIPLTALNSVIALSALIDDLFPDHHADTAKISMSVGAMNLIGCWFGSMPFCHGSGGLAGQYRFGARSEVSIIILGLCKLILGIIFGSSLVGLLQVFPNSILGVLLFISGVELASAARALNNGVYDEVKQKENWTVMLVTLGVIIAYGNDGIGFLSGLVAALILSVQRLGIREWFGALVRNIKEMPTIWRHQDAFQYKPQNVENKAHEESIESDRQPNETYSHPTLPKPVTSNTTS